MKLWITPISLSRTMSAGKMDLDSFLDFCRDQEMDGVDLMDPDVYPWSWQNYASQSRGLNRALANRGLKLAAFAVSNNFAVSDDSRLGKEVEAVERAIQRAGDVGAPALRIFGGRHEAVNGEKGMNTANAMPRLLDGIERCLPVAEKHGVVLALENHGLLPGHSHEILGILRVFDSPWLKCTYDSGNFHANGILELEDPLVAYEQLKDHVVHVHLKDMGPAVSRKQDHLEAYVAGEGTLPLRQVVARIEASSFEGYCSLEFEAAFKIDEIDGTRRSLAFLRELRQTFKVLAEHCRTVVAEK